jgi:hypothetical protein
MATNKVCSCEAWTVVSTRPFWCGAHHRELPRLVCGQEMRREKEKGNWNGVGCPRAFLMRKATMGTKDWWFSRCTDMVCTCSRIIDTLTYSTCPALGNSQPSIITRHAVWHDASLGDSRRNRGAV